MCIPIAVRESYWSFCHVVVASIPNGQLSSSCSVTFLKLNKELTHLWAVGVFLARRDQRPSTQKKKVRQCNWEEVDVQNSTAEIYAAHSTTPRF